MNCTVCGFPQVRHDGDHAWWCEHVTQWLRDGARPPWKDERGHWHDATGAFIPEPAAARNTDPLQLGR